MPLRFFVSVVPLSRLLTRGWARSFGSPTNLRGHLLVNGAAQRNAGRRFCSANGQFQPDPLHNSLAINIRHAVLRLGLQNWQYHMRCESTMLTSGEFPKSLGTQTKNPTLTLTALQEQVGGWCLARHATGHRV